MDVVIRKAELQDLDLLMRWRMEVLHEVFSIPADQPLAELEAENRRYYQKELPQGGHIACFVYIGEEIVGCGGMCLYHEMPSPDNPSGKCAYLMNVYVRPQFRGHGIASRLVRWHVEQAREHHISKIYLETSEAGRPLYQRIGFSDMKDMMELPHENAQNQKKYTYNGTNDPQY